MNMTNVVSIVEATKDDLPDIESLLMELTSELHVSKTISTPEVRNGLLSLFGKADSYLLVAKTNGITIGFLHLNIRQTASHPKPVALIDALVVANMHRRQDVGSLLVSVAVKKCRHLGCCELEASTEKSNKIAKDFYRRCGFKNAGTILEMDI
jgi:ribosomal protein S18 acetylase RimI-like enzyme